MSFSRTDRSLLAEWWFTVDRTVLGIVLAMVAAGLVLSLAASPSVAIRRGYPMFHFTQRHLLFAAVGVAAMLTVSMLDPRQVRRVALVLLAASLGMMVLVLVQGVEVNGARRWLRLGDISLQPSEIAKPGFVVIAAWLLSEARRRRDVPALGLAIGLVAGLSILLLLQPDVGQTALIVTVFALMFFLAGHPVIYAGLIGGIGAGGLAVAYVSLEYVRRRIDRFLDPASGENYQIEKALQSFSEGGLLGRGPGEGTVKAVLPDAHTDFIFAVIGEEYGGIGCVVLIGLFAVILLRAFLRVAEEPDPFVRLAVMGLAVLVSLQAAINMSVNVGLLPAKGMTLPLISSGGSSSLAVAVGIGFMLALMRRRPDARHVKKPQARAKVDMVGT
jgi:cell division protein FtsW